MAFSATFWGVRGTIPCPSPTHVLFGGNTSCVEVTVGDRTIILDCGTGFRGLGKDMMKRPGRDATVLLSHFHLDHIAGMPFFQPAYNPEFSFRVMAARFKGCPNIHSILASQMEPPLFPVPMRTMKADLTFENFRPADTLILEGDIHVRTAALNHPDGACAYRIDHEGQSLAYVTDTEHIPGSPDRNILDLIEGADLVIYDSTYTEQEFACKAGWGHSTWVEGIKLCQMAGANRLALFHHEPDHDDAVMTRLEAEAQSVWSPVFAAREGTTVTLT
ncbi:beta-lactamase [Skermanella stibiiresistens SB22]|uniref:Beta-lactamase n=1 Tax=Skermanella stibiiresistens SB22 TaxID=1385369 RepID=W9H5T2_9PROT|nr:MBL fold metallo-hydrolase [Skermanella stibiiresistens]EWY40067.1 beta-lactamase [Skermanella stibiiresistens SB22]